MNQFTRSIAFLVFGMTVDSAFAQAPAAWMVDVKQEVNGSMIDNDFYTATGDDLRAKWKFSFTNPPGPVHVFTYKIFFWDQNMDTGVLTEQDTVDVASGSSSAVWLDAQIDAYDINVNISHAACIHVYNAGGQEKDSDITPWWDAM